MAVGPILPPYGFYSKKVGWFNTSKWAFYRQQNFTNWHLACYKQMIFVHCRKIPYLDGLANGLVNGQMRDFSIAFLVAPESLLYLEKKKEKRPSQFHHVAVETHYHFPASSLILLLAGQFISIDKMIRSTQSRNWAFNNECTNYPSLRDVGFCLGKVRLVSYIRAHRFLFKPLGPAAFQNSEFFFLFWHFRKEIWDIYHIEYHTPRGSWGSTLASNVFLQEKNWMNIYTKWILKGK